jgi:spermidine/putrescine-binding protein
MKRTAINRRRFLQAAALAPAAAFLAACERQIGRQPTTQTSPGPAKLTGDIEDELIIYNWAAYLNPKSVKDFEEEFGIKVQATDLYESNEEMIAKLRGGAGGYDLVAPTGGYIQAMAEEGLLMELDLASPTWPTSMSGSWASRTIPRTGTTSPRTGARRGSATSRSSSTRTSPAGPSSSAWERSIRESTRSLTPSTR